ncbi:hypothetical protein ONS95_001280 [Cadophora gregata]|uniref:uncharacterized protein n=1 Tax=Cadophora gregata TaxID=51156 RepID=UPI0026DB39C5|nr:uncharacterized protein ONS95_001280 [Cadophora gregata]KAK0101908.1 hypothetical protein ONS96_005882 [Cadophora gregata f. sp. sojae]KAK0129353.1 hypothetical protein ONS95_001280 [Cadophora gregata]
MQPCFDLCIPSLVFQASFNFLNMGQTPAKITKQWADGPFPLIETPRKRRGVRSFSSKPTVIRITDFLLQIKNPKKEPGALSAATEMCLIHNVMIRILNCIYLQAPNVKHDKDIADFTTFMHAFLILLHEHHSNEEKHFFPMLEEYIGTPGWMEKNVEQHHAFAHGLEGFEEYVKALRAGKETYDGVKIQKLVDDFAPVLVEHLSDEIGTFEDLEKFGDKIDWKLWSKKVGEIAVKTAETDHEIPIVVTNMDNPFEKPVHEAVWPPFPWFVALMFRWIYLPRHKGAWRFSCCDWHGNPKDLEFV